jgi:hypothetical protein
MEYESADWNRIATLASQELGTNASVVTPLCYNVVVALAQAIEESGVTGNPTKRDEEREALWDALFNMEDIPGIQGSINITNGLFDLWTYFIQYTEAEGRVDLDKYQVTGEGLGRTPWYQPYK